MERLERLLRQIDHRSYRDYRQIRGQYEFRYFNLHIDHVQGDPYAAPSLLRVEVPNRVTRLPGWALIDDVRRRAAADFILRQFALEAKSASVKLQNRGRGRGRDQDRGGSAGSGEIVADQPGQEILARSASEVSKEGHLTLRFYVNLPADGRQVLGREAFHLLCEVLPALVTDNVRYELMDTDAFTTHLHVLEDQHALRAQLAERDLIAFIGDGAVLPRAAGDTDAPMAMSKATPWISPESFAVTLQTPNQGEIKGTGIRKGITLICGGGYHGKSTVLEAISRGIYDHVPGDGREYVVADMESVKLRAEDGRKVSGVDISGFIDNLPGGESTRAFVTDDASGSTSQAAAMVEALELGARALLLDEDTSATNFMIRDRRMQSLVHPKHEPITPLLDTACSLRDDLGVSLIIVMGGSGAYFDVADHVLVLHDYQARDATAEARKIAESWPSHRLEEGAKEIVEPPVRVPEPKSFDPSKGRREAHTRARGTRAIEFGRELIELDALEQLVDASQTRMICDAILWALDTEVINGRLSLRKIVEDIEGRLTDIGPAWGRNYAEGNRAWVRRFEIGGAINRLRSLRTRQQRRPR